MSLLNLAIPTHWAMAEALKASVRLLQAWRCRSYLHVPAPQLPTSDQVGFLVVFVHSDCIKKGPAGERQASHVH